MMVGFIWCDIEDGNGLPITLRLQTPETEEDRSRTDRAVDMLRDALPQMLGAAPVTKTEVSYSAGVGLTFFLKTFNEEAVKVFLDSSCPQDIAEKTVDAVIDRITEFCKNMDSPVLNSRVTSFFAEQLPITDDYLQRCTWRLQKGFELLEYITSTNGLVADTEEGMNKVQHYSPTHKARFVKAECEECGSDRVSGLQLELPEEVKDLVPFTTDRGFVDIDLGNGDIVLILENRVIGNMKTPGTERDVVLALCKGADAAFWSVCGDCGEFAAVKYTTADDVDIFTFDTRALRYLILQEFIEWGDGPLSISPAMYAAEGEV